LDATAELMWHNAIMPNISLIISIILFIVLIVIGFVEYKYQPVQKLIKGHENKRKNRGFE
jgi:hypothetical protein